MEIKLIRTIVLLGVFFFGCASASFGQDVVMIAHKDIGIESISAKEIKYVFLGKLNKINDKKIIPITLKKGPVHENFLDEYIKKNSRQFSTFWKKKLFTGKGKPPKSFKTEEELIKYVASTPGAIGYVSAEAKIEDVIKLKVN